MPHQVRRTRVVPPEIDSRTHQPCGIELRVASVALVDHLVEVEEDIGVLLLERVAPGATQPSVDGGFKLNAAFAEPFDTCFAQPSLVATKTGSYQNSHVFPSAYHWANLCCGDLQ